MLLATSLLTNPNPNNRNLSIITCTSVSYSLTTINNLGRLHVCVYHCKTLSWLTKNNIHCDSHCVKTHSHNAFVDDNVQIQTSLFSLLFTHTDLWPNTDHLSARDRVKIEKKSERARMVL